MSTANVATKRLIVALGNSAKELKRTRHNAGRRLIEALAVKHNFQWTRCLPAAGKYIELTPASSGPFRQKTILYVPTGFINTSGYNVQRALSYFQMPVEPFETLLVVHDEMEMKSGKIRYTKAGASLKGHNGLKSIQSRLGSNCFDRVKVGIGRPKSKDQQVIGDWVMGEFQDQQYQNVEKNCLGFLEDLIFQESLQRILNSPLKCYSE